MDGSHILDTMPDFFDMECSVYVDCVIFVLRAVASS